MACPSPTAAAGYAVLLPIAPEFAFVTVLARGSSSDAPRHESKQDFASCLTNLWLGQYFRQTFVGQTARRHSYSRFRERGAGLRRNLPPDHRLRPTPHGYGRPHRTEDSEEALTPDPYLCKVEPQAGVWIWLPFRGRVHLGLSYCDSLWNRFQGKKIALAMELQFTNAKHKLFYAQRPIVSES